LLIKEEIPLDKIIAQHLFQLAITVYFEWYLLLIIEVPWFIYDLWALIYRSNNTINKKE